MAISFLRIDTYEKFLESYAELLETHPEYRIGQAIYNTLDYGTPDLADAIHSTNRDPYYWENSEQDKLDNLFSWLAEQYKAMS